MSEPKAHFHDSENPCLGNTGQGGAFERTLGEQLRQRGVSVAPRVAGVRAMDEAETDFVFTYMCIYIYIYIYIIVTFNMYMCIYIYTHIHLSLSLYIYIYININITFNICTYIYIYIHAYVYIHIYICIGRDPRRPVLAVPPGLGRRGGLAGRGPPRVAGRQNREMA